MSFSKWNRAEKDKEAMKRDADDAKASMDSLARDKVSTKYKGIINAVDIGLNLYPFLFFFSTIIKT